MSGRALRGWAIIVLAALCLAVFYPHAALAGPGYIHQMTPLNNSSTAKINNVELAVWAIDGVTLRYGDTFSFNDIVGPRTEGRGFVTALNGRGVRVVGGGVAQAATTLYLALLQLDEIEYTKLHTYDERFADDYVSSGYRAIAIDYDSNLDFQFTSYYSGEITISMWLDEDSVHCFLHLSEGQSGRLVAHATTSVYGEWNKRENIEIAANSIFGTTLYRRDTFSFNGIVGARTAERGYVRAANGRGVQVTGGGVAQVASTIYLAIKNLNDVTVTEKHTYGANFTEWYVDDSDDAIMTDYNSGNDFAFRYDGRGKLTIYTYLSDDALVCEIYQSD